MTYHFVTVSNMHLVIVMHHEFRIPELFPQVEFGVQANLILGRKEQPNLKWGIHMGSWFQTGPIGFTNTQAEETKNEMST